MRSKSRRESDASAPIDLGAFRQIGQEAGLPLEQLGAALAGLLNTGSDPYEQDPAADEVPAADAPLDLAAISDEADAACDISPRSIVEAMLFVGNPQNQPLSSTTVAAMMRGVRATEIDACVRALNADYQQRNCPYTIVAEANGYRLRLSPRYERLAGQFHGKDRQARLSQAAIEVLAVVAYRGALTRDEISRLRGKPSGHILAQLVRRQLLKLDRTEQQRRVRYTVAPRFLELFGLNSLEDLPRNPDLEEG